MLEPYYPTVRETRASSLVTRTLAGCKKMLNVPTSRKRPLSLDDLALLLHRVPPSSHDNILFRAMTLIGFFALHRLGELTTRDTKKLRSSRKLIRRSSVRLQNTSFSYVLPSHKADRFYEGNIVLIEKRQGRVDPHHEFSEYLGSRDNLFPFHPALFLTHTGTVPTRSWYISRLRKIFRMTKPVNPSAPVGLLTTPLSAGARKVFRFSADGHLPPSKYTSARIRSYSTRSYMGVSSRNATRDFHFLLHHLRPLLHPHSIPQYGSSRVVSFVRGAVECMYLGPPRLGGPKAVTKRPRLSTQLPPQPSTPYSR